MSIALTLTLTLRPHLPTVFPLIRHLLHTSLPPSPPLRPGDPTPLPNNHQLSPSSIHHPTHPTSSPNHHDLPTFLAHAHRTSLSPTSPVYIGTYYEYLCLSTLSRLGFQLARTGGRSDAGIDLIGHWNLPSLPFPLRVLVQCKSRRAKASPEQVRELEGAMAGAPEGWRSARTIGVLCGKQAATKGVREAVRRCGIPFVWVMVEDVGEGAKGRVRQMLWNRKVAEMGGEGVGVGIAHVVGKGEEMEKEAVLMWEGRVWDPVGRGGGELEGQGLAE